MKKIIYKTFGIRDVELRISFLMQLYIFLVITVLLIVKPTVNALFVSQLGADSLPFGYLLVALVAVISSYFYSKGIRKFSFVKVTVVSLISFSILFFLLAAFLYFNLLSKTVLYFYYVFVALFAVIATSQFWVFANMVFNAREAKRIFGFIGAGAIAGGIFGGYLTSFIAKYFGTSVAIILAAIFILCCIPVLSIVYKSRIQNLSIFKRKQIIEDKNTVESSTVKLILESKHLTYIALITGISVIVAKLVDFQFSDFANQAILSSNDLASFFGFWFSTFNVIALIVQLFLTNKLLSKLGVTSSLLLLPLAVALSSLLFLTFPELWVLIIIKGIDGGFKQSINKAALELSVMPIPLQIKNQAKSYIDVAVDSLATGFSGFLLIFLIKKLHLDSSFITVIVIFFIFVWLILIYKLRETYFNSFKENIQKTLLANGLEIGENKKTNLLADSKQILENGDETSILKTIENLQEYNFTSLETTIIKLLDHPSNKVKASAVLYLDNSNNKNVLKKIEQLVYVKDDVLVYRSLDFILDHSYTNSELFFSTYLDHKEETIANGALLALAKYSENNSAYGEKYQLKKRLLKKIHFYEKDIASIKKELFVGLLLSIAYTKLKLYYNFIKLGIKSDDKYIVKFATVAAGITSDSLFIDDLLELMKQKKHRKKAIEALKSYSSIIIDKLLELDKKDSLEADTKKYIPRVVKAFANNKALRILLKLLKNKNATTRLEASVAIKKIANKENNLRINKETAKKLINREVDRQIKIISVLDFIQNSERNEFNNTKEKVKLLQNIEDNLLKQLEDSLKTVFQLLYLLYPSEELKMIYKGIKSNISEAKINSAELLENMLDVSLKSLLIPVIEYHISEDKKGLKLLDKRKISTYKIINYLINDSEKKLVRLSLALLVVTNDKKYNSILLPLHKFENSVTREIAKETYETLNK